MNDEFEEPGGFENIKHHIERFEEMVRNQDQYFFDVDSFLQIIDYYFEKNDPVKALQVINYACSQHPFSVPLMLKQAQLLSFTDQHDLAMEIVSKALILDPSDADIFLVKGNILINQEKYTEALENFEKALTLVDDHAMIYHHIADTYQLMGNFDTAISYLQLIISEDPEDGEAFSDLELSSEFSESHDRVIEFLNKFIDANPYSELGWFHLGNMLSKTGLHEKALEAYDYAIIIKDNFSDAYFNKGNALANLGRYFEAIDVYRQTFEYETPDALTYFNIGECFEKLGLMGEAREYYKKTVKLNSALSDAWYGIAATLASEERWYEAVHYVKKAIELEDFHAHYYSLLAKSEYNLGHYNDSDLAFTKSLEHEPEDVSLWLDYILCLKAQERYEEAADTIFDGIRHHPESAALQFNLADAQYMQGNKKEALETLNRVLTKFADEYEILFSINPMLQNDQDIVNLIQIYTSKK